MPSKGGKATEEVDVITNRSMAGFTLYELMVTLAVASVIASFAVPGFQSFVQNNRSATHTNDMVTALNLGRSEATRRGVAVELCSSSDAATCNGNNDWSNGWIVRTLTGEVIRSWPALSGGPGILTANVNRFQFQARGMLGPGAAPQLAMALPHSTGTQCRNIAVNVAGRIAVNRVACP